MCEYGFTEVDYKKCFPNLESGCNGGQNRVDYLISVDMAKQICMLQRSPEGKQIRQYFIDLEKAWDTGTSVTADEVKKFKLKQFAVMVKDFAKKDDLMDFFEGVAELVGTEQNDSMNAATVDMVTPTAI